ncbi:hypothetical protein [Ruminococcus flavefaciens]|uniref:Uncharacterized protein n=1 Tax=Ruminococcus flavefaciens TaxID=1265 RepID=A0A315XUL4_RUMFL|nr:hypothetical protein [Ruminococcus flavefaciens]PWJ10263.1 hypothetical protein IE37_03153 [Ruminococcus flavefaciens]SSA52003.1 hypothetical protein SAMN02910325_03153 [Ruminococcus flavefaciens]
MKVKIIKKVLISLLSTVLFVVILYSANHRHCYHFVEKLNYNCKGISDLNNYIDYNMLSSDLKKLISKDKFSFSNAEEKYKFCSLVSSLDYEYEGNPNSVYSTNQIGRNDLAQRITIENKEYIISVTIVFKPGWFFTPKIVDLDASVFDIDNPDWKG